MSITFRLTNNTSVLSQDTFDLFGVAKDNFLSHFDHAIFFILLDDLNIEQIR